MQLIILHGRQTKHKGTYGVRWQEELSKIKQGRVRELAVKGVGFLACGSVKCLWGGAICVEMLMTGGSGPYEWWSHMNDCCRTECSLQASFLCYLRQITSAGLVQSKAPPTCALGMLPFHCGPEQGWAISDSASYYQNILQNSQWYTYVSQSNSSAKARLNDYFLSEALLAGKMLLPPSSLHFLHTSTVASSCLFVWQGLKF